MSDFKDKMHQICLFLIIIIIIIKRIYTRRLKAEVTRLELCPRPRCESLQRSPTLLYLYLRELSSNGRGQEKAMSGKRRRKEKKKRSNGKGNGVFTRSSKRPTNFQQTSSKRPAIHVYFEYVC